MGLRHVVLFRFNDQATPERLAALRAAAVRLPVEIPEVDSYSCGRDLGLAEDTYDFVAIADFRNRVAYERYRDHPAHKNFVDVHVKPMLEHRVAVQYEV